MVLWGLLSMTFMLASLCANGAFSVFQNSLVVTTGCLIDLGLWYVFLTAMCFVKLIITFLRHCSYARQNEESVIVHLGGNYMLMPAIFFSFFVYTQILNNIFTGNGSYEALPFYRDTPTPDSAYLNQCELQGADDLSNYLFVTFRLITVFSFLIVFYYMITTCMLW